MKSREALAQLYMCALGRCESCCHKEDGHCRELISKARLIISNELKKTENTSGES